MGGVLSQIQLQSFGRIPAAGRIMAVPLRFRSWVLSATNLIFILLVAGLSYGRMATRLLNDAGIGWHIRNGEWILAHHAVTRIDPFSSSLSGGRWYAWEWLYDLAVAVIHHWTGLNGVVFFTAVVIAATFALVFRLAVRRGTGLPLGAILVVLAVAGSAIHFFTRPHVLSWLLTVVWFWILDCDDGVRRLLPWLPLLMILWVNLHGGFLLGFVLLGIYFGESIVRHFVARDVIERAVTGKRARVLATTALLCGLASLFNPYGYNLHAHVYRYLSDRFLMNHIDEFLSPDFHGAAQKCFLALLLMVFLAVAAAPEKLRLAHGFALLFAAYSGLYAARNIPVSSILFVLIGGPLLWQAIERAPSATAMWPRVRGWFSRLRNYGDRLTAMELRFSGFVWPVFFVALGMWICGHQGRLGSREIMQAHFREGRFPVKAVDFIKAQGARGPIFAVDYWGGYLIYRLYPESKVVVDDRHDFYGDQFLKDYLKAIRIRPGWEQVLDAMSVDTVLLPQDSPLANVLRETSDWKISYEDKTAALFEKTK